MVEGCGAIGAPLVSAGEEDGGGVLESGADDESGPILTLGSFPLPDDGVEAAADGVLSGAMTMGSVATSGAGVGAGAVEFSGGCGMAD